MQYSKAFFALQIRFATVAARLTAVTVERALLDYTNLYVRFGLGRAFDPAHPVWRDYLAGLRRSADPAEWSHRFYLAQAHKTPEQSAGNMFGCFSYAMQDPQCVRMHFHNADASAVSPLSIDRLSNRLDELRSLFEHVKRHHEDVVRVVGTSWLYNLPAYRRCFPDAYTASATVAESKFRNLPLWGQFLDRNGELRADVVEPFMRRLSTVANARDLARCFPLQALAVVAPIAQFYRFYRIVDGESHTP